MSNSISVKPGETTAALSFARDFMDAKKVVGTEKTRAVLITEEALIKLSEHTDENASIKVSLRKSFGNIYIDLSAHGEKFELVSDKLINDAFETGYADEGFSVNTEFGVPVAGVSLMIGINPILDMFVTTVNCLGDVVTSFMVAKNEKLLDNGIFEAAE